jgi:hypothetical protein
MRKLVRTAIACMLLTAALPASADVLSFTGSVTGESTFVGLDPTCVAPEIFRTAIDPASTTGTSSLGDFTFGTSTCLSPGGALSSGTFVIDFGADTFNGIFDGGSTPTDVAGISDTAWLFTVLGGTGIYEGASGTFQGTGTADARSRPTQVLINFAGTVFTPVPEPATWLLMILGFGQIGWLARRRRRQVLAQLA